MTEYNIGQINAATVAIGDQAQANSGVSHTVIGDHLTILQDLTELRDQMQSRAATPDQDLAVVAIDRAIESARAGDSQRATDYLRQAGRWALDVATAVGTEVAAAAIRSALHIQ